MGVALANPKASFDWTPKPVLAGAPVTFTSTSMSDAGAPIVKITWDLGGQGTCAESALAASATCSTMAPATAGDWPVKLVVEDAKGRRDYTTNTVAVQAAPPPAPPPPQPPPPPPPPPPSPNQPPAAAFAGFPSSPIVGEEVTFVSYSDDSDGRITAQAWDLDGDGSFDDATGAVATRAFSMPGQKTVTLRVTDDDGATSRASVTAVVREQSTGSLAGSPPPSSPMLSGGTPLPSLLSPFPIVRLAGSVIQAGTRIQLLTVRGPKGARALVRCRGRRCPVRRTEKVVRRGPLRLRAAERVVPAGAVLEVLVRRAERIGKFTRFTFRRNRRPVRADGCLWPGTTRMAPCPED